MSEQNTKTIEQNTKEANQRLDAVGRGWGRYLKLDSLTDARFIDHSPDGRSRRDSYQEGGTGDGANLFVLVEDEQGVHAIKVGAGEFSPRTFLEDFDYFSKDPRSYMNYASRLKKLTSVTPVYVLEQTDGYFALGPTLNPKASRQFQENPAGYMAEHARMIASADKVDFNAAHDWYESEKDWDRTPSYANEHGGGMVTLESTQLIPVNISDLEAALTQARKSEIGVTAIAEA